MPAPKLSSITGHSNVPTIMMPSEQLALPSEFVGVEVELEALDPNAPSRQDEIAARWVDDNLPDALLCVKHDGSLRNGVEFTFSRPLFGSAALDTIDAIYTARSALGLGASVRTSTHIHINYTNSEDTSDVLLRTMAMIAGLESMIVRRAGAHREANCYALPITQTGLLDSFVNRWRRDGARAAVQFLDNFNRYLGPNVKALLKYGTIEYRYFGTMDKEELIGVVNMFLEIKKLAHSLSDLSTMTLPEFLRVATFTSQVLGSPTQEDERHWDEYVPRCDVSEEDDREEGEAEVSVPSRAWSRSVLTGSGGPAYRVIADELLRASLSNVPAIDSGEPRRDDSF